VLKLDNRLFLRFGNKLLTKFLLKNKQEDYVCVVF